MLYSDKFRQDQNDSKCPFQLKVMIKNLLKMTDVATLPKSAYSPNYLRYWSQILIAQIEDLNKDCGKKLRPYIF